MEYWFTLILEDTRHIFDLPSDEEFDDAIAQIADDLFEAGCDDGTLVSREGTLFVGFAREAATVRDAVKSAILQVQAAGFRVSRVKIDDPPELDEINAQLASGALVTV